MFNLLVESTRQSRRRTPKYFLLTFLAYGSVMAAAVIGSIVFYSPALADTYDTIAMIAPQPPPAAGGGGETKPKSQKQATQKIVSDSAPLTAKNSEIPTKMPPQISVPTGGDSGSSTGSSGNGIGVGNGNGIPGGIPIDNVTTPPIPVPPPAPERKSDVAKPDNKVYKISEVQLGKALYIPTPAYPPLARQLHQEGPVKVELVVDKNGHVLSAVATSGPNLLRAPAEAAAKRATFKPTLLSGEPVVVQAVFTFNFKLSN